MTLAEEMPVSETLETSAALHDRVGISSGAVFANAVYSKLFTPAEAKSLGSLDRDALAEEAGKVGLDLDPNDARWKVFLYLALTMAPLAIVTPFIGY